jgi:hypothetical protein
MSCSALLVTTGTALGVKKLRNLRGVIDGGFLSFLEAGASTFRAALAAAALVKTVGEFGISSNAEPRGEESAGVWWHSIGLLASAFGLLGVNGSSLAGQSGTWSSSVDCDETSRTGAQATDLFP